MSEPSSGTTRRTVLTSAGIAGAAGLGMTGPATSGSGAGVAGGEPGESVVEFRGRITQSGPTGETFTSNGFLISVDGLRRADLFAGSPPAVGTALFTVQATGKLTARVLDQSVHALDIASELSVYRRRGPGADLSDPGSFASGSSWPATR
jgi:hypothetical protein